MKAAPSSTSAFHSNLINSKPAVIRSDGLPFSNTERYCVYNSPRGPQNHSAHSHTPSLCMLPDNV